MFDAFNMVQSIIIILDNIQNELIQLLANKIKSKIINKIKEPNIFQLYLIVPLI